MASYSYPAPGPPGPPSQVAPPPAPYTAYGASAPQYRGGPAGGRGRAGFHQPAGVGRGEAHPPYAPGPQAYPPAHSPYPQTAGNYPQQPQQQQQQQGWQQHPEQQQGHHPQTPAAGTPLPAQNYHPNYAPQIYQQPQYPAAAGPPQPPYQPPPPAQPYNPSYAQPPAGNQPQHDWSAQQHGNHGGHSQVPNQGASPHGYLAGGSRGRGGADRGGRAAPVMGPPIRMGFDENRPQNPVQANSSNSYQPYPDPRHSQYPQYNPSYPPAGPPHMPAPNSSYDYYGGGGGGGGGGGPGGPGGPSRGRGGFHHRGGRGQHQNSSNHQNHGHGHGNDKFRHQKSGGPATNNNNNSNNNNSHSHNNNSKDQQHQKPDESSAGKKKKRKPNPNERDIGLVPTEAKEEGVDEESELKDLIGNALLEPTDLSAYIAARMSCYPTKARIEAKESELAKLQLVESQKPVTHPSKLAQKELEAAKLRRRLERLDSQIKRKREQHDEGDDMRDVDESSSVASSEEEKPEVASATQPAAGLVPLPNKADPTKHCKYYSTGGTCGKKGKCRFVHDPAVRDAALKQREANGGRLTLEQRLLLNDKEQEDLTVLQAIQHIKDIGKLSGDGFHSSGSKPTASTPPKPAAHSSLPPPPDSLPPHPPVPARPQHKVMESADWAGAQAAGSDNSIKQEPWTPNGYGNGLSVGDVGAK